MGEQLEVSREAISDLDEIWEHIARDSVENADKFIDRVVEKCVEISELDGIGRARDELHQGLLSIPFKRYVIFFMREASTVRIVRILHGARDLPTLFQG